MISLKSIRMTQIIGTPRNIPIKPKKCPKTVIESKTQNGEIPTTSPKIFGPKNKPSNCCKAKTKTKTAKAWNKSPVIKATDKWSKVRNHIRNQNKDSKNWEEFYF